MPNKVLYFIEDIDSKKQHPVRLTICPRKGETIRYYYNERTVATFKVIDVIHTMLNPRSTDCESKEWQCVYFCCRKDKEEPVNQNEVT